MTQIQANLIPISAPAPVPAHPNLRRSRRQPPKGNTKARATRNTMGLGANIAVSVLDVSETGVRLLLKEALPQGRQFEVTLESVSARPVKIEAEIVWCVPAADGKFCVGARFLKNLAYSDMSALVRM